MSNPQMDNLIQEKLHTDNIFSQLSKLQWRFVTAMVENPAFNKKEAAEHIGIKPETVYRWPDYVDSAIDAARVNIHNAALGMRKQAVLQAVAVKVKLLESEDENIRSKAASEIIEWELGKATQPLDANLSGDIKVIIEYGDYNPKTTASPSSTTDDS